MSDITCVEVNVCPSPLSDRAGASHVEGKENTTGKSDEMINFGHEFVKHSSNAINADSIKIRQHQLEDELQLELKKLDLQSRLLRVKYENELAKIEVVNSLSPGYASSVARHEDEEHYVRQQTSVDSGVLRLGNQIREISERNTLNELLSRLELPKVELTNFSGESAEYHSFMRQFETQIESRVSDNAQRLSYLLHYCKGRAKRAIDGCVMLPGESGYAKAREILAQLFGQPHTVARALLEAVVSGKTVRNVSDELFELAIEMQNCEIALSQLAYTSDIDSCVTIERTMHRLPTELQQRWVEVAANIYEEGREPRFKDLREFIDKRAKVAGSRYGELLRSQRAVANVRFNQQSDQSNWNSLTRLKEPIGNVANCCQLCRAKHPLNECDSFINISCSERWKIVLKHKLCFVCLKSGHSAARCTVSHPCGVRGCLQRHNCLLHSEGNDSATTVKSLECKVINGAMGSISLGVVAVRVVGPLGSLLTYALVDNGSDSTFISRNLATRIGLDGKESSLSVQTVNACKIEKCSRVTFEVSSLDGLNTLQVDSAFAIDHLPLGSASILTKEQRQQWKHLSDVELSDIGKGRVEILLGCDTPEAHWSLEQRVGSRRDPFAVKTVLGWLLLGPIETIDREKANVLHVTTNDDLEKLLLRVYNNEFEDLCDKPALSLEDSDAVIQATRSVKLVNGHYEIGLPWRSNKTALPNNRVCAQRRLACLRKRFIMNTELHKAYALVIQRHIDVGYALPIPIESHEVEYGSGWYLPHHPVLNPKKPGKVRVVFDCAAKFSGIALNDCLLQGPNPVQNLAGVLLRFRLHEFALIGDIEEMFLQVKVPESDRNFLRFLWWEENDIHRPIKEFHLTVHPFGATSSPFCANFALQHCIELYEGNLVGLVREVLQNNFYVDDCLVSGTSEEELINLVQVLSDLLRRAGFRLTKWMSNSEKVLNHITPSERAKPTVDLSLSEPSIERTLGMEWDARTDCFKFNVRLADKPTTRRGILSCVSSLYDPLGLVCPILLPAKQLLQELCRLKYGWDDTVEGEILRSWSQWLADMKALGELTFPRCLKPHGAATNALPELHLFSDASEKGYGTVAYLRYSMSDGTFQCSLLFGKSRVAPLKLVTIPRLELNAAVLAVRLASFLSESLGCELEKSHFWTDSRTVLYYLTNTSSRYATFVANRVSYIRDRTQTSQWRFVSGKENPADLASRGMSTKVEDIKSWINGPKFLCQSSIETVEVDLSSAPEDCEYKRVRTTLCSPPNAPLRDLMNHYSTWSKLLRAVAWLSRFATYVAIMFGKNLDKQLTLGSLQVSEIERSVFIILRIVQAEVFREEIQTLKRHGKLKKGNRISRLNPQLCDGLLVSRGRIDGARPIILPIVPSKHAVSDLIIQHFHIAEGHAGSHHVISVIRRQFWVMKAAATVKRVIGKCIVCRRAKGRPCQQQMAALPEYRITPGMYAFESTGVDYFGPLLVKQGRCLLKRWGCSFTCLRVRAVHIEIVQNLTTDSFLMALIRFTNRRGAPRELYSDNGSNFVGACSELKRKLQCLSETKLSKELLDRGIQWNFQPPMASHRGGVWERMIRSTRRILQVITSQQPMCDETLQTVVTEVERILNNRPLIPCYEDRTDLPALSPNNLLTLRPIEDIAPDCEFDARRFSKCWKQAMHLAGTFWKRWVAEYLVTLQERQKWFHPKRNLHIGDVVLVLGERNSRGKWPLARVVKTYPGIDQLVRKVDVTTEKGIIHRDIRKISLLEGADVGSSTNDD